MSDSTSVVGYLGGDHQRCDALWGEVEKAADGGDAAAATAAFERFDQALRRHLAAEETVLFPAVEEAVGLPPNAGPTAVMRAEHEQMRGLLDQMAMDLRQGDLDALIDQGDTLLMLIQQHNIKEEGVIYPMADAELGDGRSAVLSKLIAHA
ncbi:MAG: hemerythrin domain-containing protein [Deltaproteobacteria bacterium]|nr:hemerythrin domain-containing protein [Deltaproteobacteria bacterium]